MRFVYVMVSLVFFFFSSRRRHTRLQGDWSSDVCSSDLAQGLVRRPRLLMLDEPSAGLSPVLVDRVLAAMARLREAGTAILLVEQLIEIGRASCRERG